MKITVKDIARECGVSPGTVSRVLNDRSNVKEATRKKIQSAIKKLNYDPFKNLPLINNIRTSSIGLVIPNMAYDSPHPFNQRAIQAMQLATSRLEYNTILFNETDIARKTGDEFHLGSKNIPCDALIVFCPQMAWDQYLAVLKNWSIPVVLVRRTSRIAGIPVITDDDHAGMTLAMDHLDALGHRRIAMYSQNPTRGAARGRYESFAAALRRRGISSPDDYVFSITERERTGSPLDGWIDEIRTLGVTAVVTTDDVLAAQLIQALAGKGLRIPYDMSVTGYDGDYISELLHPALTTVYVPVEDMISMGVNMLAECLNGASLGKAHVELENRLLVRESTGKARNA